MPRFSMLHSRIPLHPMPFPSKKGKQRTKSSQYCNICACVSPTKVVLFGLIAAETCCFTHTLHLIWQDKRTFCTMVIKKISQLRRSHIRHTARTIDLPLRPKASYSKSKAGRLFFIPLFCSFFIHFFGIARAGATAHRRTFVVTQQ